MSAVEPKIDRPKNWQDVHAIILDRIHNRVWKPGELIPNEQDIADEFGCARTTVNRALRAVADAGLIDRRRKAGTRVTLHPVRKATFSIPIIRQEVEAANKAYDYMLMAQKIAKPPLQVRADMGLAPDQKALYIEALHYADRRAFVYEDRWINLEAVPEAAKVDFKGENANEWLVHHAPFTRGDFAFSAIQATEKIAKLFDTDTKTAHFQLKRLTFDETSAITSVRLIYHPLYEMRTRI